MKCQPEENYVENVKIYLPYLRLRLGKIKIDHSFGHKDPQRLARTAGEIHKENIEKHSEHAALEQHNINHSGNQNFQHIFAWKGVGCGGSFSHLRYGVSSRIQLSRYNSLNE